MHDFGIDPSTWTPKDEHIAEMRIGYALIDLRLEQALELLDMGEEAAARELLQHVLSVLRQTFVEH